MNQQPTLAIDCSQVADWSIQAGWDVDYQQTGRGHFDAWFSFAVCRGLIFTDQFCNRELMIRGCPPPGKVSVVLPFPGGRLGTFQGKSLEPNEAIVLHPDDGRILCSIPDLRLCTVSVSCNQLESALWRYGHQNLKQVLPESRSLSFPPPLISLLAETVSNVTNARVGLSSRVMTLELEDLILQATAEVLCGQEENQPKRDRLIRNRINYVRHARDYIEDHLLDGVRISQVAESIGISRRTLELAFRDVFGVTPLEYIRTRRLNRVRRQLLNHDYNRGKVAALAMENGFFQLGHFARYYKTQFGELPNQTLRKRKSSWK